MLIKGITITSLPVKVFKIEFAKLQNQGIAEIKAKIWQILNLRLLNFNTTYLVTLQILVIFKTLHMCCV